MQNFINLGKDEKQQADLFRETEASTMYPPEKNSKTSKSTLSWTLELALHFGKSPVGLIDHMIIDST